MRTKEFLLKALCLVMVSIFITGCSGAGGGNPAAPGTADEPLSKSASDLNHALWGMWNITFDPDNLTADAVPIRTSGAHFNITYLVLPPHCNDCLQVMVNSFDPVTHVLNANIILKNSYPIYGYDVRGIVYTDQAGHKLMNPDAWTGLFDIPGGEPINPFKAFAKPADHRTFAPLAVYAENYLIYIPSPPQWEGITFAVDASWPGNCKEPYDITNFSCSAIYDSVGSIGKLFVEVLDWQDDVNKVSVVAPALTGEEFTQLNHITGNIWGLELENSMGTGAGDYKVRIIASSANSGSIALYDYDNVTVYPGSATDKWTRTWGGESWDSGIEVEAAADGGCYIVGQFSQTVDFNPGPGTEIHSGENNYNNSFLSRFDENGNLQWVRIWTGEDGCNAHSIALDSDENIYITGSFLGGVDFDPGPGEEFYVNTSNSDTFLLKLDSEGEYQWVRTWGANHPPFDSVRGWDVAVDITGNIYVTGDYQWETDFNPDPELEDIHTGSGAYMSKFNSSGEFQWAKTWGPGARGFGVATYGTTRVYITGVFEGTVDFDPGTSIEYHTPVSMVGVFLSSFDEGGHFKWVATWDGEQESGRGPVAVDSNGFIYVGGQFSETVDFDPEGGITQRTSKGKIDAFLVGYNSAGMFLWVNTWGGIQRDNCYGICISPDNYIYVTGYFREQVNFPCPSGSNKVSNGWEDIFLAKLDNLGMMQWVGCWGGEADDHGMGLDLDGDSNIFLTGVFCSTVDFDPGTGSGEHTAVDATDVFLKKMSDMGG